jgi:D-alanyl-D-alanine carboxypeptidase/D-alanyl-D-alanine-endopeptidase (penicillin-binding protein 4)
MHVKTGMLRDVVAIAGYVHAKSGKDYAVAMMMNHKKATHGAGRAVQDALLAWVHKR